MRREKNSYRWILSGLAVMVLSLACVGCSKAKVVVFPDAKLEADVRKAIKKPTGDILDKDLVGTGFTSLSAKSASITDLTGLEYCTDLTELDLKWNKVSNISALADLTNLELLDLEDNQISDLSALAGFTNLKHLDLKSNQISDLSALTDLTNLTDLNLYLNQINDLSALAGLARLETGNGGAAWLVQLLQSP